MMLTKIPQKVREAITVLPRLLRVVARGVSCTGDACALAGVNPSYIFSLLSILYYTIHLLRCFSSRLSIILLYLLIAINLILHYSFITIFFFSSFYISTFPLRALHLPLTLQLAPLFTLILFCIILKRDSSTFQLAGILHISFFFLSLVDNKLFFFPRRLFFTSFVLFNLF